MSKYKLIALDMDGTLLNSHKMISEPTVAAIEKAIDASKHVVLSTGRAIAELDDYKTELKCIKYGICESGALIYDFKHNCIVHQEIITSVLIEAILAAASKDNIMIHLLTNGNSVISKNDLENMQKYHMAIYQPMFRRVSTTVNDISEYARNNKIEKINLYHVSPEARARSYEILKNLPLSLVLAETTSLEITPLNVNKATGLMVLCDYLDLDITETIAVGDANNDLEVLKTAGLAIAMKNAADNIKEICDVIVSDNDHHGCKEAIEDYLM